MTQLGTTFPFIMISLVPIFLDLTLNYINLRANCHDFGRHYNAKVATKNSAFLQLCISPSGDFTDIIWATVADRNEVILTTPY
jgi:hypothetical protein